MARYAAAVGNICGKGLPDIIAKPWSPRKDNAVGGRMHVTLLGNLGAAKDGGLE